MSLFGDAFEWRSREQTAEFRIGQRCQPRQPRRRQVVTEKQRGSRNDCAAIPPVARQGARLVRNGSFVLNREIRDTTCHIQPLWRRNRIGCANCPATAAAIGVRWIGRRAARGTDRQETTMIRACLKRDWSCAGPIQTGGPARPPETWCGPATPAADRPAAHGAGQARSRPRLSPQRAGLGALIHPAGRSIHSAMQSGGEARRRPFACRF